MVAQLFAMPARIVERAKQSLIYKHRHDERPAMKTVIDYPRRRRLCVAGSACRAGRVAEFYRGKTVRITVGSAVGGGYDGYARLVGRHFGKHIPGNPTVVVQNIPGSGSNKAASYIAMQAPKDGTAIGAIQAGAIVQPLRSDQQMPHDPSKFIMLGSASSGVYLCLVRADAPVTTFAETFTNEVLIGTSGEGATLRELPILLVNVLGVKLRLIGGYAGSERDPARDRAQGSTRHVRHELVEHFDAARRVAAQRHAACDRARGPARPSRVEPAGRAAGDLVCQDAPRTGR